MKKMTLDEIRKSQLEILKYLKKICDENNLRYYLTSGTLLGAVRHRGYIPWDDDIDVDMPRPDYLKLVEIMKSSKNDRYELVCMHNNKDFTFPLAKMIDKKTVLIQNYGFIEKVQLGVYVNIFVLDGLPTDINESNKFIKKVYWARKKWYFACRKIINSKSSVGKNIMFLFISIPFKMVGINYFLKKLDKLITTYNYDRSQYVGHIDFGDLDLARVPKIFFGNGEKLEFEGELYSVPERYDEYLKHYYGDYMKLPPEDKRVSNHDYTAYWK